MSASRMRRWSKRSGAIEPGRVVHRDLRAEAAVAEIGPVADLAVADAHQIGQSRRPTYRRGRWTACHRRRRASVLFLRPAPCARARAEPKPASASEGCQQKTSSSVMRISAWPSPVRSTNLRLGLSQSEIGQRGEGYKGLPALVFGALVETRGRPIELDQIQLAVAGQIQELLASAADGRERGLLGDPLDGCETGGDGLAAALVSGIDRAQVPLVEPAVGLFGEDAGHAFAVEVDPLVASAIQAVGQVLQTLGVDLVKRLVDGRLGVFELQRRQRFLEITAWLPFVTRLGHREQEGEDRIARAGGIFLV